MVRKSVVILLVALLSVGSASLRAQDKNAMSVYKVARFIQYLSNDYVDTINTSKIVEKAIVDMLGQLDPHSFYISREDVQAANEPLEGNFEGVGVEFNILHDTLIVVNPVPAGPSERAGIIAGDRIISVDGKVIAGIGLKNSDVFKLLRGPKGTKVVVTVLRRGLANNLEFTITRDKIPILSLDASYMLAPKIGYVKLNRFALTSEEEFVSALLELQKEGMKDLVLDLRGNGGGYLNAAVAMADHFFEKNNLLVFTEGRNNPRTDYVSSPGGLFTKGKVIVLIDEGSASASEILAGAIQDWDRGIVIGRRSFGKGLVQNQMPLPDGSMIRLTVARYHTPSGRVIQRPYNNGEVENYYKDLYARYSNGEVYHRDSIVFPDSLKYFTLHKKRVVYGGGGIMPDLFVPIDTSFYSDYYGKLIRAGVMNQFTLNWVDANRADLAKQYPNFKLFEAKFQVTEDMLQQIVKIAKEQKVELDEKGLETSKTEIQKQVKALIAQSLFSTGHYFRIVNKDNATVQKALNVLQNWKQYKEMVQE